MVCPFTPQLSLVLINRPRRDGTLSLRWCTAATGGIRTHDLAKHRVGYKNSPFSNNKRLNTVQYRAMVTTER